MKCIQYYNPHYRIVRVSDDQAHAVIKTGKAMYVPKSVWKKHVRDKEQDNE